MSQTTFGNVRPTRFDGLGYANDAPGLWRVVDTSDGWESRVGPQYKTKMELLADLDRYATEYGCNGPYESPDREVNVRDMYSHN